MRRQITHEVAQAASMDAGNRAMRAAGRAVWNEDDYNASTAEYHRLLPCPAPFAATCDSCSKEAE